MHLFRFTIRLCTRIFLIMTTANSLILYFILLNYAISQGVCSNVTTCLQQWDCKWRNDIPFAPTAGVCSYMLPWYFPIDGPSSLAPEGICNFVVDCGRNNIDSSEMFECMRLVTQSATVESLLFYRCTGLEIRNGDLDSWPSLKEFNVTYSIIKEIQDRVFYHTTNLVTLNMFPDFDDRFSITEYPKALIGNLGPPSMINDAFLPKLRNLILSNFVFESGIPQNAFQNLQNLKTLVFSFVTLQNNDFHILRHLKHLTHFQIYDSKNIYSLPMTISDSMPNLRYLEISLTNISNITFEHFQNFNQLETLVLSQNKITTVDIMAFQNLNNLKILSLQGNRNLRYVPFLDKMTRIENLDFSHCAISDFSVAAFSNLDNLKVFDLGSNELTEVPSLFKNFPSENITLSSIEEIDLSHNDITIVDTYTFSDLIHLKSIDLYKNNISRVNRRAFFRLPSLENVHLEWNVIKNVSKDAFYGISYLKTLDLQGNLLTNFPVLHGLNWNELSVNGLPLFPVSTYLKSNPLHCTCDMFKGLFIRVGWDQFEFSEYHDLIWPGNYYLSNQLFIEGKSLTCYSGIHGTMTLIDEMLSDPELWFSPVSTTEECPSSCRCLVQCSSNQFYGLCNNASLKVIPRGFSSSITLLSLRRNEITRLNSTSFTSVPNIVRINLEENSITTIEDGSFLQLSRLRKIVLRSNKLTVIYRDTFNISSSELTFLDLSMNQLVHIDPGSFLSIPLLSILMLDNNNLVTIPQGLFDNLTHISYLTISDNPLNCTCDILYLTDWYVRQAFVSEKQISTDIADLKCAPFSNETELYEWIEHKKNICNPVKPQLIPSHRPGHLLVVAITAVFVTGLLSGVIYKYRLEILVLIYVKTGLKIVSSRESEEEKQFDAFISFSSIDMQFVEDELMPRLESETHKRKLCIHHRDFAVGECIATNIINAIENSNKIVILCSKNYLESEWCSYEFKTSHQQALRDRSSRIVLIMMEDVKNCTLDKELKAYISTSTYLERKDPLFWSKLLYSVPATSTKSLNKSAEINANQPTTDTFV